jgi:Restriction endonuclease
MEPEFKTPEEAISSIATFTKPAWFDAAECLPFEVLTDYEFEVFCYSLWSYENKERKVVQYGKSKDLGRDVVCYHADDIIEVIQCKHYQDNLDIGDVKKELAKLYVNMHKNSFPYKYTDLAKLTFAVTKSMSPNAKDLISHQNFWLNEVESALKAHLNLKKEQSVDADLLNFASSWFPKIELKNGHDLTVIAKKHLQLIREFFDLKVAILGDIAEVTKPLEEIKSRQVEISDKQNSMGNQLDEIHRLLISEKISKVSTPEMLHPLLAEFSLLNPGREISVDIRLDSIVFTLTEKEGSLPQPYGTVSFADTETGRVGHQKLKESIEKGTSVTLTAEEFIWMWEVSWPEGFQPRQTRPEVLVFEPQIPSKEIPVSLLYEENNLEIPALITNLKLIRWGTKESEMRVGGLEFHGGFNLIYDFDKESSTSKISIHNVSEAPILIAIKTFELCLALSKGNKLIVRDLKTQNHLFNGKATSFGDWTIEGIENTLSILKFCQKINSVFKVNLTIPKSSNSLELDTIRCVGLLITEGKSMYPTQDTSSFIFELPKDCGESMIEAITQNKSYTITLSLHSLDFQISNTMVSVPGCLLILDNPVPVIGLLNFSKAISSLDENALIKVELVCQRIIVQRLVQEDLPDVHAPLDEEGNLGVDK